MSCCMQAEVCELLLDCIGSRTAYARVGIAPVQLELEDNDLIDCMATVVGGM